MRQTTACYHCSLPVPEDTRYSVVIDGSEQSMCCPGCQAVASTIISTGLSQYYNYRTSPAVTANPLEQSLLDELRLYDRADIQQDFVSIGRDNHAEALLIIEGITCAACTWLIEHQLTQLSGVDSCTVNLSNARARVVWDPAEILFSDILATLYRIGYRGHPYQPAKEDALRIQENRLFIKRLGVAGIGMAQVMMYAVALYAGAFEDIALEHRDFIRWVSALIATPVVFYSARPFFSAAWRNLATRHLGMDVPISIAIAGAYSASLWSTFTQGREVYFDSVCMFTFFLLLGRFLEFRARNRMDQASNALNKLLPDSVILLQHEQQRVVAVRDLKPGDEILVKAGQAIPTDGIVIDGHSSADESAISGEFLPVTKTPSDLVIAGSLNVENPIAIRVTEVGAHTRLSGILRMLDQARAAKPPIAILADKVAQYFVGGVILLAALVALTWWLIAPQEAFWITLSVLVVTCPCALSLATPTALTAATGSLHKLGFLITHSHTLEALSQASHVIFDKTGTLTEGKLTLEQLVPVATMSKHQCYNIAAALEVNSEHPIANAFNRGSMRAEYVKLQAGAGIEGVLDGMRYRIGTPEYALEPSGLDPRQIEQPAGIEQGQWILLADSDRAIAWFQMNDQLRPDAKSTVNRLADMGFKIELLSGDYSGNVANIANQLGIRDFTAGASPQDKMTHIQNLQHSGAKVIMVGDGINDIPVLASADVSVAMTNASDLTKTNADTILLSGQLAHLAEAIDRAAKTRSIIKQNIAWALIYNLLALPLAALGHIPPYLAAIGMSTSSLVVVFNALRLNSTPGSTTNERQQALS